MTRGARMLLSSLICIAAAWPAGAADKKTAGPDWGNPAPAFKDLPGVVTEQQRLAKEQADEPKCTTDIEYRRWRSSDIFAHDGMPVRVYRCEKNGIIYSGTQMPDRPWVPGLSPQTLPKEQ